MLVVYLLVSAAYPSLHSNGDASGPSRCTCAVVAKNTAVAHHRFTRGTALLGIACSTTYVSRPRWDAAMGLEGISWMGREALRVSLRSTILRWVGSPSALILYRRSTACLG